MPANTKPTSIDFTSMEGIRVSVPSGRAAIVNREPFAATLTDGSSHSPTTCGELIEAVTAVIASCPPYLSKAAIPRHLCMLNHLRASRYEILGVGANLSGPLSAEPLERLGIVLRLWIDAFAYGELRGRSRLFAVCALDSALTALAIAFGGQERSPRGRTWTLAGLFPKPPHDVYRTERLRDSAYKLAILGSMCDSWLVMRVPAGFTVELTGEPHFHASDLAMLLVSPSVTWKQPFTPTYQLKGYLHEPQLSELSLYCLLDSSRIVAECGVAGRVMRLSADAPMAVPARIEASSARFLLDWIVATVETGDDARAEWAADAVPWCK